MGLDAQSVAELSRLLSRKILGKLLQSLLLQRLIDRVRGAPTIDLWNALPDLTRTDLTGAEGAAKALTKERPRRLLYPLLRREMLDDLLQRLRALDRMHRLFCGNLLGDLDRRHGVGLMLRRGRVHLLRPRRIHLLRPRRVQLREVLHCPRVLRPRVLRGSRHVGREIGNAAGVRAAIPRANASAAEDSWIELTWIELSATGCRIEQLGEIGLVISIAVKFWHVSSPFCCAMSDAEERRAADARPRRHDLGEARLGID